MVGYSRSIKVRHASFWCCLVLLHCLHARLCVCTITHTDIGETFSSIEAFFLSFARILLAHALRMYNGYTEYHFDVIFQLYAAA